MEKNGKWSEFFFSMFYLKWKIKLTEGTAIKYAALSACKHESHVINYIVLNHFQNSRYSHTQTFAVHLLLLFRREQHQSCRVISLLLAVWRSFVIVTLEDELQSNDF